jgi:hypothetical protein
LIAPGSSVGPLSRTSTTDPWQTISRGPDCFPIASLTTRAAAATGNAACIVSSCFLRDDAEPPVAAFCFSTCSSVAEGGVCSMICTGGSHAGFAAFALLVSLRLTAAPSS